MKSLKTWLTTLVAVTFVVGCVVIVAQSENRQDTPTETDDATERVAGYNLEQVAEHDDEESCWTVIDTVVYDMTTYIAEHPGGKAPILAVCGQDGSSIFNTMPAAVIPAAKMVLAQYKIGVFYE